MANFIDRILGRSKAVVDDNVSQHNEKAPDAFAGTYSNVYTISYDGEKNLGEIGPVINYLPDYASLRFRSWQSLLESEIARTVLSKFRLWVVAYGLKLQAAPSKTVLQSEGINIDTEKFNEITEARFAIWADSKSCDYSGMRNLVAIANEAFDNAKIGGDVLVVLRVVNGVVKIQLIDGAHLCSPVWGNDLRPDKLDNGNTVKNGIEQDSTGKHIAYHVKTSDFKIERIEATSKSSGLTTAFLVYGMAYRLDNNRGIPVISTVLETISKLERYKEATVATAEEIAKVSYQILHDQSSTGENPMLKAAARAMGGDLPIDSSGVELANKVIATTNKQAINMPIGAEAKPMQNGNGQLYFKDFYSTNIDIVCAAIGIPPNVAMSIYNDSFSASRAATKDWEHTIKVNRKSFSDQFYQKIYELWLHVDILKNKIQAPGYINAFYQKNETVLSAYRNARFTGPLFPHIDPLKEVRAEREKLGPLGANLPLSNMELSTEVLNSGDADSNMEQFSEEIKYAEKLGIKTDKAV